MKVLLVEDNVKLAKSVAYILEESNYQTTLAHDGETGLEFAKNDNFGVIILDVMLPGIDGVEVCRQIRLAGINTPIIMLTAKDSVSSKIEGYDSGADDYMTKPFSPSELLAHLRALQRRKGEVEFETKTFGDLTLNIRTHEIACGDNTVHLTNKEFDVLHMILSNNGNAVSKKEILQEVWHSEDPAIERNIRTYVSFIRDKLELIDSKVQIQSISKAGYRAVDNK